LKQAKRRAGPGGSTRQLHHIHFVVTRNWWYPQVRTDAECIWWGWTRIDRRINRASGVTRI